MSDNSSSVEQRGLRTQLDVKVSSPRTRVDDSFGRTLERSMAVAANVAAGIAAPFAPKASAVLAAAYNGSTMLKSAAGSTTAAPNSTVLGGTGVAGVPGTGVGTTGGLGGGGYFDAIGQRAATGDASSQMMMATRQMQELNQVFNLQYLQLQQKIQGENRQYTALSNVMKSKHDTAKNALNNLK